MTASMHNHSHVNSRVEALRAKHQALSKKVDSAQKRLSTTDFYIKQLKKQKLMIKEALEVAETKIAG